MSDIDIQRLFSVLEEIRDNQRIQLERQAEALCASMVATERSRYPRGQADDDDGRPDPLRPR